LQATQALYYSKTGDYPAGKQQLRGGRAAGTRRLHISMGGKRQTGKAQPAVDGGLGKYDATDPSRTQPRPEERRALAALCLDDSLAV
jgi:hypothetical protein